MSTMQSTLSDALPSEDEFKSDVTLSELSAAANRCESVTEVSQDLRIPFHKAKHDLRVIGRLDELARGRSFAKELRAHNGGGDA